MYSLPQEIEVWYIIPAIRKELARIFISKHHLNQVEAAKILGISKSAVSQYFHSKRAQAIDFPRDIKNEIERSASIIIKDNKKVVREILRVIALIKRTRCMCDVCNKYNKGIVGICSMKPVGGY